jgi:hypothetical protein
MTTQKFNMDCLKSHYNYQDDKPIEYVSVFVADKNGCFTKSQAEKFVADNSRFMNSTIKNPVVFIYETD